jgi:hypothetical protein
VESDRPGTAGTNTPTASARSAPLALVATLACVFGHRFWRSDCSLEGALALTAAPLSALGDVGPISLYALLQHLPGVSGFRLPSRCTLVFLLFATAMVGAAWSRFAVERAPDASRG